MTPHHNHILLVEHSAMVGNIIVSTARQLELPSVHLVTSIRSAQQQLQAHVYAGLILALDEESAALQLLDDLRTGNFKSFSDTPLAVTTAACDVTLAKRLKVLDVRRILLKPFKIRDVIATIDVLRDPAVA